MSARTTCTICRNLVLLFLLGSVLACFATPTVVYSAESDAARFLDALKDRGYYDMARLHLEQLRSSPDAPADMKDRIDYELAEMYRDAASKAASNDEIRTQLTKAEEAFADFIKKNPEHELIGLANISTGQISISKAKLLMAEADAPGADDAEKSQLRAAARTQLEEAKKRIQAAEKLYYDRAKELAEADTENNAQLAAEFEEVKGRLLQSRLLLPKVTEETGLTYPKDSKKYKELLTEAAAEYKELFSKYKTRTGGLYAKLDAARVLYALGNSKEALKLLEELTIVDPTPETMNLKMDAVLLRVKIDNDPEVKAYFDAVARVNDWQENVSLGVQQTLTGLEIHLWGAKSRLALARAMQDKKSRQYHELIKDARRSLEMVQRYTSPLKREASLLLLEPEFSQADSEEGPPKTFDDALARADKTRNELIAQEAAVNEAKLAKDQAAIQKAQREMDQILQKAIADHREVLYLANSDQASEDVNRVRYILAQLYFMRNELYHTAVLAEAMARHYPTDNGAKNGLLAGKAYRKMILDAKQASEDTSFATARLEDLGDYVTTRWVGTKESDEISLLLIDTAIDNADLDRATALLDKIDAESPRRASAELRLGQMLFLHYAGATKLEAADRPPQEELDRMLAVADTTLTQGVGRVKQTLGGAPPDLPTVASVLFLAQIKLNLQKPDEAIQWLTDPVVGPITLIEKDSPVVAEERTKVSAYTTALQAYVGAQKLDEAEKTMDKLENLVGKDEASSQRLTLIYIQLGQQLEDLLTRLGQEGKNDEARKVSEAFENFLNRIAARDKSGEYGTMNWIAGTYFSLASGLEQSNGKTDAATQKKIQEYYTQALSQYKNMLLKAEAAPGWAPEGASDNLRVRLAGCARAIGKQEAAIALLRSVLESNPMRVDVQMEAAKTYQAWGKSDPAKYDEAITGAMFKDGKPLVWGWGGIAQRVASHPDYRQIYFEATYNKNYCRLLKAVKLSGSARDEQLQRVESDVMRNYQLDPTMGGPEWFRKFDVLLRTARKARGDKQPEGLRGS